MTWTDEQAWVKAAEIRHVKRTQGEFPARRIVETLTPEQRTHVRRITGGFLFLSRRTAEGGRR